MSKRMKINVLSAVLLFFFFNNFLHATLPKELHGTWTIHKKSTAEEAQKSPKWKPEDTKRLPRMLNMLGSMTTEINADSITQGRKGRTQKLPAKLDSSQGQNYLVSVSTPNGREMKVTIKLNSEGLLNMRFEGTDDFDYMIWKKGTASSESESDAEILAGIMGEVLNQKNGSATTPSIPPNTSPKKENEAQQTEYEIKRGRLKIHQLTDAIVEVINGQDTSKISEVALSKSATQESFEKIEKLPWIKKLTVDYGNESINSFEPVSALTNLTSFTAKKVVSSKNTPIDLAPFSHLKKLVSLDFFATKVKNTDALKGLSKMKDLNFYMSAIDSLEMVTDMIELENLNLYGYAHTFENYVPLLNPKKLKTLNIYMNKQATDENLKILRKITSLEEIHMSNSREVTSLNFLAGSKGLKNLQASWAKKLSDISALKDMNELTTVNLKDCLAEDFSVLKDKPQLRTLSLAGTSFSDLSFLSASTQLSSLDIHDTPIKNLKLLEKFTSLRRATLPKDTPSAEIDALKATFPKLRVQLK
jgi:hypothetical protein